MTDIGHNSKDQLRSIVERVERVSDLIAMLDTDEVWRPIAGWPGYEVSSWGATRSGRGILQTALVHGYQVVTLSQGGRRKSARVHRLVAGAFLGPAPFLGAIVAHNDGDRLNNRIGNLRWASARENQADRRRHYTYRHGSAVHGAKLKEADIPTIRTRIADGEPYLTIADDYGVSISTISLINKNRIWRSAGGAAWRTEQ